MKLALLTLIATLLSSSAFAGSGPSQKIRREWNFTKTDYAKLRASGRELQFSQRSLWMPEALRESLLSVLNFSLDPSLTPSSTNGINRLDFFHGHMICSGTDARIGELSRAFEEQMTSDFKAGGFNRVDNPTTENFATFAAIVDKTDQAAARLLNEILPLCQNSNVSYHSFEYNMEKLGIAATDLRRHLYAPLGGGEVTRIEDHPVDPLDALKNMKFDPFNEAPVVHAYMFHFGFLIDQKGVIHVTNGSGFQLHRFTGSRD